MASNSAWTFLQGTGSCHLNELASLSTTQFSYVELNLLSTVAASAHWSHIKQLYSLLHIAAVPVPEHAIMRYHAQGDSQEFNTFSVRLLFLRGRVGQEGESQHTNGSTEFMGNSKSLVTSPIS